MCIRDRCFTCFSRGQVLVRDSNNSDWIYIVKSVSMRTVYNICRYIIFIKREPVILNRTRRTVQNSNINICTPMLSAHPPTLTLARGWTHTRYPNLIRQPSPTQTMYIGTGVHRESGECASCPFLWFRYAQGLQL